MQDSREKKRCLIFARNNANDTADRIEAYAKKSGMGGIFTERGDRFYDSRRIQSIA